LSEYVEKVFHL